VSDVVEKTSTRCRSCVVVEKQFTMRPREGVEKNKKVGELSTKIRVIYSQQ